MSSGKLFEIFVRKLMNSIGFSNICSDGLYIFNGSAGQMIQGLGEAHNADVLVEPPVQIPFTAPVRLLIECKDYCSPLGLNIIRSALGLKEDVNHFEIVDSRELINRRGTRRSCITYDYTRYQYQIAVASISGFSTQAQKFALTHRITLIDFTKLPFWKGVEKLILHKLPFVVDDSLIGEVERLAIEIATKMAIAVLDSGQLLFLYNVSNNEMRFNDHYTLHWENINSLWSLICADNKYVFNLPTLIRNNWLENSSKRTLQENAIVCKQEFMSSMVVYYTENCVSKIKMISIDKDALNKAKRNLLK